MKVQLLLLTILLQIALVSARNGRGKTMEEANCPKGCTCDRTNVFCPKARLRSDVFGQIHSRAFPYLETVIMSGNHFGDLSENPFGDREEHDRVTLMNFTDNRITRISQETFHSTPNVEFLYLGNNKIVSGGTNTFKNMQKLRRLDLSSAIDRQISSMDKSDLLRRMFETDSSSPFAELSDVFLKNNSFTKLHPTTFCNVKGLMRLDLAHNDLHEFNVSSRCLEQLKHLDLSHNNFTTLPESLWESLEQLTSFDISGNPLHCDCSLMPFIKIAQSENSDFLNQGKTICASPPKYAGKDIFSLKVDLCNESSGFGFGAFFIILLIAAAGGFAYRHYYMRRRTHIPLPDNFGYHDLNNEDVQPEFV